ncbi:nitrate reductase molybdenum cofactor assembly chaperone [Virgibacillus sp. MSP4-1]|uniref:nitrate reductase molybdenum cofactor assembly chaperone n=1 Tax=Virgibacillus sp. MSP4-1 TaxID=2700081 RepID=UPI0003A9853D|nr:nitrate reductase molybdenum cofactor assembly chaperone [Virgibacillus sp. MSP4-1]
MNTFKSELLVIASRILSYPTEEDKQEVMEMVKEIQDTAGEKKAARKAVESLYQMDMTDLQELYVETFDLRSKLGLYLSAHEFGDSPKRGAALIRLQKIINEAGYERTDGELADFIPMLYEFLAIMEEGENKNRLIKRLSVVTQSLLNELPKENPYYPIISLLMQYVFEPPTKEDLEKMEQQQEKTDLEELPYPIMYQ